MSFTVYIQTQRKMRRSRRRGIREINYTEWRRLDYLSQRGEARLTYMSSQPVTEMREALRRCSLT